MTHHHKQMKDSCNHTKDTFSLCNQFARILGAEILTSTRDLCVVTFRNVFEARCKNTIKFIE